MENYVSKKGPAVPASGQEPPENATAAGGSALTPRSLGRVGSSLNPTDQLTWPLPNTVEGAEFLRSHNLSNIIPDLKRGRKVTICNLPDPQGAVRGFQVLVRTSQPADGHFIGEVHEVPDSLPQLGYMGGTATNPQGKYMWMEDCRYLNEVRDRHFTPYIVSQGDVPVGHRHAALDKIEEEYTQVMPKDIWNAEHYFLFDAYSFYAKDNNASLNHLFHLLGALGCNVARMTVASLDALQVGLRDLPLTTHLVGWRKHTR